MIKFILEIKNRLFLLGITWISSVFLLYFYKEVLLFLIIQSHISATTILSQAFYFIFTDVTELFSVYIDILFFFSSQIVLLYLIYHFFFFFAPATFNYEYWHLLKMLQLAISLWVVSIVLIHEFLVPSTWNFFLSFPLVTSAYSVNLHFEARLSEYLSFYVGLYYICIFYLQIFSILFFFLSYKKINEKYIKKVRKLYYYCFVLLSTFISPPDILSQILISFFIICFYEILLVYILFKKN